MQGAYPTFAVYATDDDKKLAISEFIRDEHGIKVVDVIRELLKNQFIEAIDEDYILELKQGIQEWNGRTLLNLLTHVHLNYATMDDIVYNSITKSFAEPHKRQILYGGRRRLDRTGVARRLPNVRGLRDR